MYRIAILYVHANEAQVLERAKRRAELTGRVVPVEEIKDSLYRVPRTVAILMPKTDFVAHIKVCFATCGSVVRKVWGNMEARVLGVLVMLCCAVWNVLRVIVVVVGVGVVVVVAAAAAAVGSSTSSSRA